MRVRRCGRGADGSQFQSLAACAVRLEVHHGSGNPESSGENRQDGYFLPGAGCTTHQRSTGQEIGPRKNFKKTSGLLSE